MEPGPCELNTNTRSYTIHESSIAAVNDPKALVWILTWHLSVAVSISLYISEFWSVFVVEKEIFKLDAS